MEEEAKRHYNIFHHHELPITLLFIVLGFPLSFADYAAVMMKLAQSFTPPSSSWSGSNPCKWTGVGCDSSHQVTSINLIAKSISEKIPPDLINNLSALRSLALQGNQISGSPVALGSQSSRGNVFGSDSVFFASCGISVESSQPSNSKSHQQPAFSMDASRGYFVDFDFFAEFGCFQCEHLWPNSLRFRVFAEPAELEGPVPVFRKDVVASVLPNSFCNPTPGPCDPQMSVLLAIAGALGYPTSLAESWKGNNACKDWSHVTCDSAGKAVTKINLAKQGLVGTISPAFANLTSLTTLVLSDNGLFGEITRELASLKQLQRLDVSKNNPTGKVPDFSKNMIVTVDGSPFIGTNVDTTPHTSSGSTSGGKESSKSSSRPSSSVSPGLAIVIVKIIVAVLAFLIWFFCIKKGKMKLIV